MSSAAMPTPTAAHPGSSSRPASRTRGLARHSTETAGVLKPIIDTFSRGATRLWRNNVGMLRNSTGRPVAYGLGSEAGRPMAGTSDAIGLHVITITADMVGRQVAVFTAIEAKGKADLTDAQRRFLLAVHNLGGIAGCARSIDDARAILEQGPWLPPIGM